MIPGAARTRNRASVARAALALFASTGLGAIAARTAEGAHLDVWPALRGTQIETQALNYDAPFGTDPILETRVFRVAIDFGTATDPGFSASPPGTAFPAGLGPLPGNAPYGFDFAQAPLLARPLAYWSGAGAVSFGPAPAGVAFTAQKQTAPFQFVKATIGAGSSATPGFRVANTLASGSSHQHVTYVLEGANFSDPPVGVYLVTMRFLLCASAAPGPGSDPCPVHASYAPSKPFFFLFGYRASLAQLAAAEAWVVANLVDPPDSDGDGVTDDVDNCVYAANPDQLDRGGVGAGSLPDGVGDACQCGDVSADGRVTTVDAVLIARSLLTPPTAVLANPPLCDVGGAAGCTLSDAVIVRGALLVPPTTSIAPVCAPARPPAP